MWLLESSAYVDTVCADDAPRKACFFALLARLTDCERFAAVAKRNFGLLAQVVDAVVADFAGSAADLRTCDAGAAAAESCAGDAGCMVPVGCPQYVDYTEALARKADILKNCVDEVYSAVGLEKAAASAARAAKKRKADGRAAAAEPADLPSPASDRVRPHVDRWLAELEDSTRGLYLAHAHLCEKVWFAQEVIKAIKVKAI